MRVKRILADVRVVIADIEVNHDGALRSSPTLCAVMKGEGGADEVIPLNTPDGRPILMNAGNKIAGPG